MACKDAQILVRCILNKDTKKQSPELETADGEGVSINDVFSSGHAEWRGLCLLRRGQWCIYK